MSARTPDPIFVVGYMHSGTTLVLNLLGNHPELFCAPEETKFFLHPSLARAEVAATGDMDAYVSSLITRGVGFRTADRPGRRRTTAAVDSDLELGRAFRAAMDGLAHRAGRRRWVEKTPAHVFHTDRIVRAIPDAVFVEIIRDPRDVLASKKTRLAAAAAPEGLPPGRAMRAQEQSFDPLWDALSWRSAVRAGAAGARRQPGRWHRLRYEDLVAHGDRVARELLAFLGLAVVPGMLDVPRGAPADLGQAQVGPGISTTSVGRWSDVLTPAEVALCERAAGREMEALGYRRTYPAVAAPAIAATLARRSLPELAGRLVRRYRTGGLPYVREIAAGYAARLRSLLRG